MIMRARTVRLGTLPVSDGGALDRLSHDGGLGGHGLKDSPHKKKACGAQHTHTLTPLMPEATVQLLPNDARALHATMRRVFERPNDHGCQGASQLQLLRTYLFDHRGVQWRETDAFALEPATMPGGMVVVTPHCRIRVTKASHHANCVELDWDASATMESLSHTSKRKRGA